MTENIKNKITLDYWVNKLKDKEIQPTQSGQTVLTQTVILSKAELTYFHRLTKKVYLAEYTVLVAVYTALLKRYFAERFNGLVLAAFQSEVPTSNQQLLLALEPVSKESLKAHLQLSREEVLAVNNYKGIDVGQLQRKLSSGPFKNFTPFGFSYTDLSDREVLNVGLQLRVEKTEDGCLSIGMEYVTGFVSADLVAHLLKNFHSCIVQLEKILPNEISQISLLDEAEEKQILEQFNNNGKTYPVDQNIVSLIEQQVERNPNAIAMVYRGQTYTYDALNRKVNQVAHFLLDQYEIKADDVIGVLLPKSDRCLISMLAILKTGAAFLPIDTTYPTDRINYIIQDSGLKLLICSEGFVSDLELPTLHLENAVSDKEHNPCLTISSNQLAYVIYTSGSTGRPKGVMVEHRSNINMSFDQIDLFELSAKDRVVWFASIAFDASVSEIMMALYSGSTLLIPDTELIKDKTRFVSYLQETRASVITFPPSYLDLLKDEALTSLRCIITAGEAAHVSKACRLSKQLTYFNAYGPTECAVCVSTYRVQPSDASRTAIPIGKPIANLSVFILDEALQIVPIGVEGKIYVSGIGLARGYINNTELTKERFLPNPFLPGERMYDTGDMGRWLPDGNIEFLGRKDMQVKVRGHRIELEEIANSLLQCDSQIQQASVVVQTFNDQQILCAFLVQQAPLDKPSLKERLAQRLPEYMLPARFVQLDQLPLTANGKVDKKQLMSFSLGDLQQLAYEAPRDSVERQLTEIWQEVLGLEKVGISNDFFEMGGHSLIVAQLINRMQQQLGKTISVKEFYAHSTIKALRKKLQTSNYQPIPRIDEAPSHPLTPSQKRLWVLSQMEGGSQAYNMPGAVRLNGKLEFQLFEEAFRKLIARYEILRTTFKTDGRGEVRQHILSVAEASFKMDRLDLKGQSDWKHQVDDYLQKQNAIPFSFEKAPLLRASVIDLEPEACIFFLSMHHIISDGWSMEILINEVVHIYNALLAARKPNLPKLSIQYKDYVHWLAQALQQTEQSASEKYWLKQLEGELPQLNLPSFKKRPLLQTYHGSEISHSFSKDFLNKLKSFASERQSTLFMVLSAGINALLFRYTGQQDIILGTPVAGRDHPALENQLGLFLNTLAIRTRFDGSKGFNALLANHKTELLNAYEHQEYPFDALVGKLPLKRDTSRSALFDVMVILQSQHQLHRFQENKLDGLTLEAYDFPRKQSQFDLTFTFQEEEGLNLRITYNTDIYDAAFVERIFPHFENLLSNALIQPERNLREVTLLQAAENGQIHQSFNATTIAYPHCDSLLDVFAEIVAQTPDKVAVVSGKDQLTFKGLDERSNQLAHHLLARGIQSEELVPICMDRSVELLVAILGILKAGAAYVPIDPMHPSERMAFLLEDTSARLVLTQSKVASLPPSVDQVCLEDFSYTDFSARKPSVEVGPSHLAYAIYTSGTTGRPKGVLNEHGGLLNRLRWMQADLNINGNDVIVQKTTYTFDVSIWEFTMPLVTGCRLVFAKPEGHKDPEYLQELIDEEQVSIMHFVPSMLGVFLESLQAGKCSSLQHVVCSGEALPSAMVERFKALLPQTRIHNLYGPTEAAIDVSSIDLMDVDTAQEGVSIGKAVANTKLYVLNESLELQPVGVIGELYIGGIQVARSYLNRPDLTAAKFIDNPYTEAGYERLYKTGDLVRWLPDGQIEFIGRRDHQVKIRGQRVELGEIEKTIENYHPELQQVVLQVQAVKGEKVLVAYLGLEELDKTALRNYLSERLPEYMIPTYYVALESFPLTANGKVDRRAMPLVSEDHLARKKYQAPRNHREKILAEIWQEVLGIGRIGIQDNFFEMGGHSLMVAQIINRTHRLLNQTVSFQTFFSHPTIATQSEQLNNKAYQSIAKAAPSDGYPLTPSQNRLWLLSQMEGGSSAYHMPFAVSLTGPLDVACFESAMQHLIARHEILRTSFRSSTDGSLLQYIHPSKENCFELKQEDYRRKKDQSQKLASYLKSLNEEAFDLSQPCLLRAALIRTKKESYVFFMSLHHLIADGWSMELLFDELIRTYNSLQGGEKVEMASLPIQYKDYAVWLSKEMQGADYGRSRAYWLSKFAGELPVLDLPTFQSRPLVQSYNGAELVHHFDATFLKQLKDFSSREHATLFMTLMAGINALLHRYTGQQDLVLGTPVAGREHPDVEDQLGLYLNTLAIRTAVSGAESFTELLAKQKQILLESYEHQRYPFDALVGELDLKRDTSRSALFDVLVVLQNQEQLHNLREEQLTNLQVEPFAFERNRSQFDITLTFTEEENLKLHTVYNPDVYSEALMERLFVHLESLLTRMMAEPMRNIQTIDFLQAEEKSQLLDHFNQTTISYPADETLLDLFQKQVEKTPRKVAVVSGEDQLTFKGLDERSNQLAHHLLERGIQSEELVPICMDRSVELLVAILGILKAGAAYVPIDPTHPSERMAFLLEDTSARLVLTQSRVASLPPSVDQVCLEDFSYTDFSARKPSVKVGPSHLAYAIYTSGTTGRPKGVLNEHGGLLNRLRWMQADLNINGNDVIVQKTTYTFDVSVWEFTMPLITGCRLVFAKPEGHKDPEYLQELIDEEQISIMHFVPSMLGVFLESLQTGKCASLQHVVCSGEALPSAMVERFKVLLPQTRIHNLYGPTEAAIDVSSIDLTDVDTAQEGVSIGKAVANTKLYVLNESLELQPVGVMGELYIGGIQVARSYLNRPDLTAAKFIDNPYTEAGYERLYKTGDLVRWLLDGQIEFIGRRDHQVKIRGQRVELGEIEKTIENYHPELQQVVLQVQAVRGEKVLVAYLGLEELDKTALRSYLSEHLPEYMIPTYYVALESFPLTANGKVDRRAMPPVSEDHLARKKYQAPRNHREKILAEIWQEVLGIGRIGIQDNFFEMGGHSLMVAQIINRTHRLLNQTVSFQTFFSHPTIAAQSEQLNNKAYQSIAKALPSDGYPLTPSQNRLWLLSQMEGGSSAYHMPFAVSLTGPLDMACFESAMQHLIARHEILRTSFRSSSDGSLLQYVHPSKENCFELKQEDYRRKKDQSQKLASYLKSLNEEAFDLSQPCLLRAALIRTKKENYVFFMSLHHLISDGWSMELLFDELIRTYNSLQGGEKVEMAALSIQYKDYAVWLSKEMQGSDYGRSRAYWLSKFAGELPVLDLPTFQSRPLVQSYNGAELVHHFDATFLKQLKDFSSREHATLFMTLMAGINALLHRYTGQQDLVLGTPVAGREHPDVEDQLGLYLNTLAIRTAVSGAESFTELLAKQKQVLLESYEHQRYPFDALVGELDLKRDTSRSALFDVLVVLQNQEQLHNLREEQLTNLKVEPFAFEQAHAQFDLTFTFKEGNGLDLQINYNSDLYDPTFIQRIFNHLESLLQYAIGNASEPIGKIDFLSETERKQQLVDFNDTAKVYPKGQTIVQLFEERAAQQPNKTAVVFNDKILTYKTLNEAANRLANYLTTSHQVGVNDLLVVKMERSEMLIVSLLAILKAGAAYVPIDAHCPPERAAFMEKDSQSKLCIDDEVLTDFRKTEDQYDSSNPQPKAKPNDLAYVIYTSGTTGQPKGVLVEHHSMMNTLHWFIDQFDLSTETKAIQLTDVSFDPSIEDIFGTLASGGRLHIIPKEMLLDTSAVRTYIDQHQISMLNYVPKYLHELLGHQEKLTSLKYIISGGEKLSDYIRRSILDSGYRLFNNYGPTEATVDALSIEVKSEEVITIGRPVANCKAYILDAHQNLLPLASVGELYLSGAGLARGYLKRAELTAQRFIPHPFESDARLYRTGDLARWRPDGRIEFLGRNDQQLKVRGHRIELGEIEQCISQFSSDIQQVCVRAEEQAAETILLAYYVCQLEIAPSDLHAFLQARLPSYMLPTHYIPLDALPMTSNGKVDHRALPGVPSDASSAQLLVGARNAKEAAMLDIWQQLLGTQQLGVTDNFFEKGGHSLKVVQLVNQVQKQLNAQLEIADVFAHPTIAEMVLRLKDEGFQNIPTAPILEDHPLSPAQSRLWVLCQFEDANLTFNMPASLELRGRLEADKLEKAFQKVVERHEVLRTRFLEKEDGSIRQQILPAGECLFQLQQEDVRGEKNQKALVDGLVAKEYRQAFDLTKAPLLRATLIRCEADRHLLLFSLHHIVGDGWSVELLTKELMMAYDELRGDAKLDWPTLTIQYKDYCHWLIENTSKQDRKSDESFWLQKFSGELPVLELPAVRSRPPIKTHRGAIVAHRYSKQLRLDLQAFAEAQGATLFMLLMAGINGLFSRYTNATDIILGTVAAGREHPDLENQIGLYLNTLAIRTQFNRTASFADLLQIQKAELTAAYAHQQYPFDLLVDGLKLRRDTSRSALFDVMVVLQNQEDLSLNDVLGLKDLDIQPYAAVDRSLSQFDMALSFSEDSEGLQLHLEYNVDIYDAAMVQRLVCHLGNFLKNGMLEPAKPIHQLSYLDHREQHQLLRRFNDTAADFPKDKNIMELFVEQAQKTPDKTALVFEGQRMSYRDLDRRSNQLAHYLLRNFPIGREDLIAVKLQRSADLIVAVLAALKTGGAYVPIDTSYPPQRVAYIEQDSQCKATIDETLMKTFEQVEASCPTDQPKITILPTNLAYVIYTSGSTGKPKGVMIEHRSLINLCTWHKATYKLSEESRQTLFASVAFDASVWEIYPTLVNGGTLYPIADSALRYNVDQLVGFLKMHQITHTFLPPQMVQELVRLNISLPGLTILTGGDVLKLSERNTYHIFNNYGPTENTVVATYFDTQQSYDGSIPIGKPIHNTTAFILSDELELQPVGVVGELCLAGDGLARGYWNRPALTATKFVQHPFDPTARLYRTGDLARWLPDGNIEFVGRKDTQIKIRGYRIELEEIEQVLLQQAEVVQALALVRDIQDNKAIIAYLVTDGEWQKPLLRAKLAAVLPDYMIPSYFVEIDVIPLTANGKIDRKALPDISPEDLLPKEYVAPSTEIEHRLVQIWQEVLEVEKIGLTDNFFELGGQSIKATRVLSMIERQFHTRVDIQKIFVHPTIEFLALEIENANSLKQDSAKKAAKKIII